MIFVAYLSGCPSGPNNAHKHKILSDFVNGVNSFGDEGILHQGKEIIESDVAFIQGWIHQNIGSSPHLNIRKDVILTQRVKNKRLLVADSNLFNYIDANVKKDYIRYSFDGIFPTTGNYFDNIIDSNRWKKISKAKNISLKPWIKNGKHILICTQRNGGWSMRGLSVVKWLDSTLENLRKYTDRPIIVRGHPGDRHHRQYIDQTKYNLSYNYYIKQDFINCHAVITYNSSPAVAAGIEGVPVFVTDPFPKTSQAFAIANKDISTIENPRIFDRQHWVEKLSMSHWNNDEIASGEAWEHIRKFV
ncbi:hypothetical protein IDH28_01955 [Pelagibacterales bacterium SAG-MED31]|nr:hypothetical protein [Pelagibacterales bacterium SAG-MED31]